MKIKTGAREELGDKERKSKHTLERKERGSQTEDKRKRGGDSLSRESILRVKVRDGFKGSKLLV